MMPPLYLMIGLGVAVLLFQWFQMRINDIVDRRLRLLEKELLEKERELRESGESDES